MDSSLRALGLAALGMSLLCCARADAPVTLASGDARVEVRLAPFALTVRDASGQPVLRTLQESLAGGAYGAPGAVEDRPTYEGQALGGWDGYRAHERDWLRFSRARVVQRSGDAVQLSLDQGSEAMAMSLSIAGPRVRLSLEVRGGDRNKAGLSFALPDGERFFGLGERFASFDHRGLSLYSWAEEGGLGQGESAPAGPQNPYPNGPSMTWFPVPFLISSGGYAIFADTTARLEWHLGSERADAWRLAANATRLSMTIYVHAAPIDSLRDYTQDSGRPAAPAPWLFGPRREVGPGDQVNGVDEWRALRDAKVPTTALDDNVHFLPARSELGREDALRAWTAQAHAAGFKVLGYYTPYVSQTLPGAADDLAYGVANGLFVKGADGTPLSTFFSSGAPTKVLTIDLTNPDGFSWFQALLSRSLALGYDGWMHDFGEYLPREAVLWDGRSGAEVHNEFPLLSARAARELLDRERPGDHLFFARSGTAGSQGVADAIWSGDPEASFDETTGLPANLRAGLSLALAGVAYWGSDVGGYKCLTDAPHDKEMYLRWAAVGAVSPMMMNDTACFTLSGHAPKWTLWSDAETTAIYARFARLHTRLQPYWLTLAREASASGVPPMRPLLLQHADRAEALRTDDAFFLGPALFAAPVVRRGLLARTVWLPPGRYVDLDSLQPYAGDQVVTIPAPLDKLPLLLVEGQLLPLLDESIETLAPASDGTIDPSRVADRLDVRVALGPGASAQLTLADGTRLAATRISGAPASTSLNAVDPSQIADCALCFASTTESGLGRVRANGPLASDSSIDVAGLRLSSSGGPARRVRWDVALLP